MNQEQAVLELTRRLIGQMSKTETAVVDALEDRLEAGESLEDLIEELAASNQQRRARPGEMGLHEIVSFALPIVMPAIWELLKAASKKLGEAAVEHTAEKVVDAVAANLAGNESTPVTAQTWLELEAACAKEAKRLGLGEEAYRSLLQTARSHPEMLILRHK